MRRVRSGAIVALTALFGSIASGQITRLQSRVDAVTYAALKPILDSAKKADLPTKAIEDKALEGASAGASGPEILTAVRLFVKQLGIARTTLGPKVSSDELRTAVGAIDAGIPPRDLLRFRSAAPKRSIATALTVVGDIIGRGVPLATSSNLVVSLLKANVKDAELLTFDRNVRQDIANGGDPSTSAAARAKGLILSTGGSR